MKLHLLPHPATPPAEVRAVTVELTYTDESDVLLCYRVEGSHALAVPDWTGSTRADDLWRTTCFEAFLRAEGEAGYVEFNFSPSTRWAAYRFTGERQGRSDLMLTLAPHIAREGQDPVRGVDVDLDLSDLAKRPLHAALAAVIEEVDGTISYWALAHPSARPDFHHPGSFVLELPAMR